MPDQPDRNRPSISRIGMVAVVGTETRVTGWALGSCATGCRCHLDPDTGGLVIAEDQDTGSLGLASYGPPCDCCQAWTADELASVLRDVATAARLLGVTST